MNTVLGQSELVTLVLYAVVGIISSARVTRLLMSDDFPPVVKFRVWWDGKVTGLWNKLMHCMWCLAPRVVLLNIALAYVLDRYGLQLWWFLANGWLAAAYASAWLVYHDEDGA